MREFLPGMALPEELQGLPDWAIMPVPDPTWGEEEDEMTEETATYNTGLVSRRYDHIMLQVQRGDSLENLTTAAINEAIQHRCTVQFVLGSQMYTISYDEIRKLLMDSMETVPERPDRAT